MAVLGAAGSAGGPGHPAAFHEAAPAIAHRAALRVGERLEYSASIGRIQVGSASLTMTALEEMRGQSVYHSIFRADGRFLWYRARNHTESWFDTTTLSSVRLEKIVAAGAQDDTAAYDFYADRGVYVRNGQERPTVTDPVDEGSLLYFVRTLPLADGDSYSINRYYRPDRNPIEIKVIGREKVTVPAGTFDAVIVSAVVKSSSLFSEKSDAKLWISTDPLRRIVRIQSKVRVGTLRLDLKRAGS